LPASLNQRPEAGTAGGRRRPDTKAAEMAVATLQRFSAVGAMFAPTSARAQDMTPNVADVAEQVGNPAVSPPAPAQDAAFKMAEKAGIPTAGIPTPPSSYGVADLWKSWGTSRTEVAVNPADFEPDTQGPPVILLLVGAAALLGLVLPLLPKNLDDVAEDARKKGRPEWLLEEEAKFKAEREQMKADNEAADRKGDD